MVKRGKKTSLRKKNWRLRVSAVGGQDWEAGTVRSGNKSTEGLFRFCV